MEEGQQWLLFSYNGEQFNYLVEDSDKISYFDLVRSIVESAMQQSVIVPQTFRLYYKGRRGTKVGIDNDLDLMKMFGTFGAVDEIKVFLEAATTPSKNFRSAMSLKQQEEEREKLVEMENELRDFVMQEEREKQERERQESEVIVEPLVMQVPVLDENGYCCEYLRTFDSQESHTVEAEGPFENPTQTDPLPPPNEPPSTDHTVEDEGPFENPTQTDPLTPPNEPPSTDHASPRTHSFVQKTKVPKTTAKRRGTYVRKENEGPSRDDVDQVRRGTRRRSASASTPLQIISDNDDDDSTDEDFTIEPLSSDGSETEEEHDETDEDLVAEDVFEFESESAPTGNTGFDECLDKDEIGEYMDNVYKNGHLYPDYPFGQITH